MENLVVILLVAASAFFVMGPALARARRSRTDDSPCRSGCAGCNLGCDVAPKAIVMAALFTLVASPALALDTVETFDVGASNAEYYAGFGGVGLAAADRDLSNEIVLGYGLADGFSAYLGTCVAVEQQAFRGETSLCFGLMGTPVDTEHVDLDLLLDVGAGGGGLGTMSMAPAVELNFDRDPDMATWGLYLRAGLAAAGQEADPAVASSVDRRLVDFGLNPGAYLRVGERHEVLVEFDLARALGDDRTPDEDGHGFGVGLNSMVTSSIELITQVHRAAAVEGESAVWSLNLGFIASLPGGD